MFVADTVCVDCFENAALRTEVVGREANAALRTEVVGREAISLE